VFVTIFLIFKFNLIYLLHVLFVFKIEGIFEKRKSQPKKAERGCFIYLYLYLYYKHFSYFILIVHLASSPSPPHLMFSYHPIKSLLYYKHLPYFILIVHLTSSPSPPHLMFSYHLIKLNHDSFLFY